MTAAEARQGNTNARLKVADPSRPPWLAWRTKSRSARCVRFIESYLVVPKGHGAGQSVRVAPFQRELLEQLLDDDTLRSAVVSMPRGQGKSTLTLCIATLGRCGK